MGDCRGKKPFHVRYNEKMSILHNFSFSSHESEDEAGDEMDQTVIPTTGVKLECLRAVNSLVSSGNVSMLSHTSGTVCLEYIKPLTDNSGLSFNELMLNHYATDPHPLLSLNADQAVGRTANVYVIHSWLNPFSLLVQLIEDFVASNSSESNYSFWIDIFSCNQWNLADFQKTSISSSILSLFDKVDHTLVILDDLSSPLIVSRMWCLFEIYCSKRARKNITFLIKKKLLNDLNELITKQFDTIAKNFSSVNIMNASTTVGSDYDCILKALSRGAESESPGNGIEQINDALTNIFADYFYSLAQQVRLDLEAKNRAGQPQELLLIPLLVRIAKFKLKQEMLREAEVCAKAALEMCENLLGPDHQESCVCKYVWLQVLYHAKRFDEAQAVGRELVAVTEKKFGVQDERSIACVNMLVLTLQGESGGRLMFPAKALDEAEERAKACTVRTVQLYGQQYTHTMTALNNLATVLYYEGKYREAEQVLRRVLHVLRLREEEAAAAAAGGRPKEGVVEVGVRAKEGGPPGTPLMKSPPGTSRTLALTRAFQPLADATSPSGSPVATSPDRGHRQTDIGFGTRFDVGTPNPGVPIVPKVPEYELLYLKVVTLTNMAMLKRATEQERGLGDTSETQDTLQLFRDCVAYSRSLYPSALHHLNLLVQTHLASYLLEIRQFSEARKWLEGLLALYDVKFTDGSYQWIVTCNNLCMALHNLKEFAKAERMYLTLAQKATSFLGKTSDVTHTVLMNVSLHYLERKMYSQAEEVCRRLISFQEEALRLQPRDAELGASLLNSQEVLGTVLRLLRRSKESEAVYKRVLAARESQLGEGHPGTVSVVNHLGALYKQDKRWYEAEKMYRRAVRTREEALTAQHPLTVLSSCNLAALLKKVGKVEEAAALFSSAYSIMQSAIGLRHKHTLEVAFQIGVALQVQGRWRDAEDVYRQVYDGRVTVLGSDHEDTLAAKRSIGVMLKLQRRWGEAEEMMRGYLVACEKKYGDGHVVTYNAQHILGSVYLAHVQASLTVTRRREAVNTQRRRSGTKEDRGGENVVGKGGASGGSVEIRGDDSSSSVVKDTSGEDRDKLKLNEVNGSRVLRDDVSPTPIPPEHSSSTQVHPLRIIRARSTGSIMLTNPEDKDENEVLEVGEEMSTMGEGGVATAGTVGSSATTLSNVNKFPYSGSVRVDGGDLETPLTEDELKNLVVLALELFECSLRGRERLLGKYSDETAQAAFSLGVVCQLLGRDKQSSESFERSYHYFANSLGEMHAETINTKVLVDYYHKKLYLG